MNLLPVVESAASEARLVYAATLQRVARPFENLLASLPPLPRADLGAAVTALSHARAAPAALLAVLERVKAG